MSKQTIRRAAKDAEHPYRSMSRALFEDVNLSFAAKGVMGYILVKPDDWEVSIADLMRVGSFGRDKAYKILDELIEKGYCERVENRNSGQFASYTYLIHEIPLTEKPYTVTPPLPEKPYTEKPLPVFQEHTNKEVLLNKKTTKSLPTEESATQPPAPPTSLAKKFSELLDELKTTKNRPACLREISILCFGDNSDTPTYAYLAKAAKQVGGAGRLAEEMWKLTARPPTGDVLAYILGKCKSQKNGNGFGLTNWRKNNGEDSAVEDTSGDSGEQADFWRNHFANNPVIPTLPAVQGRGLGVRS